MSRRREYGSARRCPRWAAVLAVLALTSCGEPESPYPFWDMYLGMSFAEFDSISQHDQAVAFTCEEVVPGYRDCSVPIRDTPGSMNGVVDSLDRLIEFRYVTGAPQAGDDNHTLANIAGATQKLWALWAKVDAPDSAGSMADGTLVETWRGGERGRYTGRIEWWKPRLPRVITLADEESMHPYRQAREVAEWTAALEAPPRAPASALPRRPASSMGSTTRAAPTRWEAEASLKSALRRLASAQGAYLSRHRSYARTLRQLEFAPPPGIRLGIAEADRDRWWATANMEDSGENCVIWGGLPPAPMNLRQPTPAGVPTCL